jgi:hypothetical protein
MILLLLLLLLVVLLLVPQLLQLLLSIADVACLVTSSAAWHPLPMLALHVSQELRKLRHPT